jgi:UDP-N-acetylmuramyl pentapeptide phosphotransferase/UDP-N-acetylglucosamine-1-phosphate transferase
VCGADGTLAANEIIAFTLASERSHHDNGREVVMIFAVIGCLLAGLAGIVKACNMTSGFDVLLCLLGATGAFGLALCVYFGRR